MNGCVHARLSVIVLVMMCVAISPMALADQVQPPARIADIYGGRNHQPTRTEVEHRERAAGIQPDVARQSADDAAVRQLFEELTQRARIG